MKKFEIPEYSYKAALPKLLQSSTDKSIALCFVNRHAVWERLTKFSMLGILVFSLLTLYVVQARKERVYVSAVSKTGKVIANGKLEERILPGTPLYKKAMERVKVKKQ